MIKRVEYLIAIVLFMALLMILQVPLPVVMWIIVVAVVIVGFVLLGRRWESRKMRVWENFAYDTGLKYTERKSDRGTLPFLEGEYRGRHVEIHVGTAKVTDSAESGPTYMRYTEYCVGLKNRRRISMHVYKETRLGKYIFKGGWLQKIGPMLGLVPQEMGPDIDILWQGMQGMREQDIPFDDPDCFDLRFKIKGNSESDIKAILDPYIRGRIVQIMGKRVHITVPIAEPNIVRHFEWGQLSDPQQLRLILDLMVDIAENIEKR